MSEEEPCAKSALDFSKRIPGILFRNQSIVGVSKGRIEVILCLKPH
jgi:hypothetical protein